MKQPKSSSSSKPANSTPPKLSLLTPPQPKQPDTPGYPTPPLQTPATVPFQWEEVPGKPLKLLVVSNIDNDHHHHNNKPKHVRSLELPPRMITTSCTPSPTLTTVLESQCDRTLSSTWSFRKLSTKQSSSGIKKIVLEKCKKINNNSKQMSSYSLAAENGTRSSRRWGGGRSAKVNKEEEDNGGVDEGGEICSTIDEVINVKKLLKNVKRKGSFFNTRFQFWARVQESVHEGLKQVAVPWRRSSGGGQNWK